MTDAAVNIVAMIPPGAWKYALGCFLLAIIIMFAVSFYQSWKEAKKYGSRP